MRTPSSTSLLMVATGSLASSTRPVRGWRSARSHWPAFARRRFDQVLVAVFPDKNNRAPPSCGHSLVAGAIWSLALLGPKFSSTPFTLAVERISAPGWCPRRQVGRKAKHRFLDRAVWDWAFLRFMDFQALAPITRDAMAATVRPIALATKGNGSAWRAD